MPGFWHVMRSFYDGDTYPGLPTNIKLIDQLVSTNQAEISIINRCRRIDDLDLWPYLEIVCESEINSILKHQDLQKLQKLVLSQLWP
jgi:hypothetical protein